MRRSRSASLRALLTSGELSFLMEAHNPLSARIAEQAGFQGLWGSGLALSASLGVRDSNELSWTQVLDMAELITDVTSVPLLLDGDTGYGDFNTLRRVLRKLEGRNVAGICIEDKLFPKTNSFIGDNQPLASIPEFCGKIKAAKDAQRDPDFCVVARVEAFIAGHGLDEALKRAEAYRAAGADAVLIHSRLSKPDEILAFAREWARRAPLVIVPTTYYGTPVEVFRHAGVNVVIWANHLLRSAISAMVHTAQEIRREEGVIAAEGRIAPLREVFLLQNADELVEAERRYLPAREQPQAVILAATRGTGFGDLTADRPKAMVPVAGKPLLEHTVATLREIGIKDITVVRGYRKDAIQLPNLRFSDNEDHEATQEVFSLRKGLEKVTGTALVAYGDVLFHKFIPMQLLETDGAFCIAVDSDWRSSRNRNRYADLVVCDRPYSAEQFDRPALLRKIAPSVEGAPHGEWMGLMRISRDGIDVLRHVLAEDFDEQRIRTLRMAELLNHLVATGHTVRVVYARGHWFDIDDLHDLVAVTDFGASQQEGPA